MRLTRVPFAATDWQIVHAIYSLEAFLYDLQKRGAEFHIAFFQGEPMICS
jgi:hypothetical protein